VTGDAKSMISQNAGRVGMERVEPTFDGLRFVDEASHSAHRPRDRVPQQGLPDQRGGHGPSRTLAKDGTTLRRTVWTEELDGCRAGRERGRESRESWTVIGTKDRESDA
jgi:hypothetical protein